MNDMSSTDMEVWRPSAAMNPARLDYLWGLSERIAKSSIVPETLRGERNGQVFKPFDDDVITANVFAVVEQADRLNASPFGLLAVSAVVRGKLMFEGKAIAAILDQNHGIELHQYFTGAPFTDERHIYLSDKALPESAVSALAPGFKFPGYRIVDGSVSEWKTTGSNTPWRPQRYDAQLVYRGNREWMRLHKPAAVLGILGDDEIDASTAANERRALSATDATPIGERFAVPANAGFNVAGVAKQLEHNPQVAMELVNQVTGEVVENSGAQSDTKGKSTSSGPKATEAATTSTAPKATASAAPAGKSAGGAGSTVSDGGRPQSDTSAQPGGAGDDGGGGADTPIVRVSADIWRGYHSAIARMTSAENVEKAHGLYWSEGAGKGSRIKHPDDIQLGRDIKEAHLNRVAGKLEAGYVAKEIDGWIQAATKGGEL